MVLPKIQDGAYVVKLAECEWVWTHWIVVYVNGDNVIYFDSFGVEYISKKIQKFLDNKNIITNIYRIQAYDSIICRYFWVSWFHVKR